MLQINIAIFLAQCPHRRRLSYETAPGAHYCHECGDDMQVKHLTTLLVFQSEDGTITISENDVALPVEMRLMEVHNHD
jgi:hypothetical protein